MSTAAADIEKQVARMKPITLEEMDSIKLMNRIDSKYVTSEERLVHILSLAAEAGYMACEIQGERITGYDSVYYDTPQLKMYLMHHNGIKVRQKVRIRTYKVNGLTFLEIKRKNNKGRTKKKRCPLPAEHIMNLSGSPEGSEYLASHSWFHADEISPQTSTAFNRITLVNPSRTERLTIDMNLRFTNFRSGLSASLHDAVIIELKQDGRAASQFKNILLESRVHPLRISKYCIGTALTEPGIKKNRFKMRIRKIEKIINKKLI